MLAMAPRNDADIVSRRAHGGQKKIQTTAACVFLRRCKTRQECKPARLAASTGKRKCGTEVCGAPGAKAQRPLTVCRSDEAVRGPAPSRQAGLTFLPDDHGRAPKRLRETPEVLSPEPTPVCNVAPDARLCGRGWHTRWPPPVRATAHPVQTSLRDLFARCQAATADTRSSCVGSEGFSASSS